MYDFAKLFQVTAENGPIVMLIVLALVRLYGAFGLKGKAQLASSLGTGILVGGCFHVAVLGVPIDFAGWFATAMSGLILGLTASGVYEVGKDIALKVKSTG